MFLRNVNGRIDRASQPGRPVQLIFAIFAIVVVLNPRRDRPGGTSLRAHGGKTGGAIQTRVRCFLPRYFPLREDRSPSLRAWYTYPRTRNCRISVGCCGFPAKYITFLHERRVTNAGERALRPREICKFYFCRKDNSPHARYYPNKCS